MTDRETREAALAKEETMSKERKAARKTARALVDEWHNTAMTTERMVPRIADALQRERDEAERECIRAACFRCAKGMMPMLRRPIDIADGIAIPFTSDAKWCHEHGFVCGASGIHELRRRRTEEE